MSALAILTFSAFTILSKFLDGANASPLLPRKSKAKKGKISGGVIAAIIIIIIIVVITLLLVLLFLRRRKSKKAAQGLGAGPGYTSQ